MPFSVIILGSLLANAKNAPLLFNIRLQQSTGKQYFHSTLEVEVDAITTSWVGVKGDAGS